MRFIKIIGCISNILNSPIILAEEDRPNDPDWYKEEYYDQNYTWTVFYLENLKERVEFWFLGESSGYYSEDVECFEKNRINLKCEDILA